MIVDAHGHLGSCTVFDLEVGAEEVLRTMDASGIDVALLQPFPGAPDAVRVHDDIAELARRFPGRIFGVVSANPRELGKKRYLAEVDRCVNHLGFVGVKLHTYGHAINPLSEIGSWVFEAATAHRIPIEVHTGTGLPFADPAACITRALEYPSTTVILAHSGWGIASSAAYAAAKVCPNVYLETSWSTGAEVEWWVKELGANRVMMGADLPNNRASELAKYRALELVDSELDQALGATAAEVYGLRL